MPISYSISAGAAVTSSFSQGLYGAGPLACSVALHFFVSLPTWSLVTDAGDDVRVGAA